MKRFKKADFPVDKIRRLLEPGPIVLLSSAWRGKTNIMTMGWHAVTGLTPAKATMVKTPPIEECHANFQCKIVDGRLIQKYNFFILECVKAHAATAPKYPRTVHYRGDGMFLVSGSALNMRRKFKPEML